MLLLLPMVASGYLLQTAVAPGWRQVWTIVHLATSGIWILAFVGHVALRDKTRSDRDQSTQRAT
jgi:thiosulfate reductase cytochrome b subunit